MGNYFSCKEKQILRRMQSLKIIMNMEIVTNFEALILGLHIVDLWVDP